MTELWQDWEGAASAFLDETGFDGGDAFIVARLLGLQVLATGAGASLEGDVVYYNPHARRVRQQGPVMHESGHKIAARYGLGGSEEAANWIANAVQMPREQFVDALHDTSWNLKELKDRYPYVSAERICYRIIAVKSAFFACYDNGKLRKRVASPWIKTWQKAPRFEPEMVQRVLGHGETELHEPADVWAYPVFDGQWKRVLVIGPVPDRVKNASQPPPPGMIDERYSWVG